MVASRERSPNYPNMPLAAAVRDAILLYRKEKRSYVPSEVAAKAWGYTSLSGPSRSRIAALRQYGLIESDKAANIRVTQRTVALALMPAESPEHRAALHDAALTPPIFRELFAERGDSSDDSLRYYLVAQRKFSREGAGRLIDAYRATLEFAGVGNEGYDGAEGEAIAKDDAVIESPIIETKRGPDDRRTDLGERFTDPEEGGRPLHQWRFELVDGVKAEVVLRDGRATQAVLDHLQEFLRVTAKGLPRDLAEARAQEVAVAERELSALPSQAMLQSPHDGEGGT